ncbi:MAG: F0F1 ATP synthase subunit gamma, partial [Vulcanimicrobiaceae bacterium]
FMKPGKVGAPAGVILMTADKGLAGSFNSNAISAAEEYRRNAAGGVKWYSVGVKGRNYIRRRDEIEQYWPQSAGVKLDVAREIARKASEDFLSGKTSKIVLISQHMQSMMVQRPQTRELVPVAREKQEEKSGPRSAVEFEPNPESVLSKLLPKYLEFTIYSAMLETDAAFFAAQLIAMSNATDNAGKIIDEITLEMNKARQAAITKEILEIVGGAEALAS